MQQPLAVTVIGGLLSSTLLTLVVIPAVYETVTRPRRTSATEEALSSGEVVP
ncbi:MAG: efflux RND transporter permease subunit [Deltaproteobacteria bacterium]|nr:efflux RND transporter permease subunit [Deltaproteobacteria bacterium]